MTCLHRHSGTNVSTRCDVWGLVPTQGPVVLAKGSLSSVAPLRVGLGLLFSLLTSVLLCYCVTHLDSRALFSCCGRLALLWCTPVAWMVLYVSGMPGLAACLLTTGATLLRSWTLPSASKHCGLAALESGFSVR